jgi:hypothetical protein
MVFFNNFSNSGGGGEKVLFIMLKALLKQNNEQLEIAVITGFFNEYFLFKTYLRG